MLILYIYIDIDNYTIANDRHDGYILFIATYNNTVINAYTYKYVYACIYIHIDAYIYIFIHNTIYTYIAMYILLIYTYVQGSITC